MAQVQYAQVAIKMIFVCTRLATLLPMTHLPLPPAPDCLTSYFWCGNGVRSRSVGSVVLSGRVEVPALPARLVADCAREVALEPGDVEALSLPRARTRWPDYKHCVQAVADWLDACGVPDVVPASDVALMACRGAHYHHDGAQYGGAVFCNLFLSPDRGLDVHFPGTGQRIPLAPGTVLVFDTCQPHAVIDRHRAGFDAADFPPGRDATQLFLTWELPIAHAGVVRALGIAFDTDPACASQLDAEQVWVHGAPARVCPESGRWLV